ncbi:unnamed protein product [Ambrosiozyma monospora]|uniref:Unnamed protein product n=1 Tax=Ambrosiozyma monospora TaxID=43982 RepID=A0A9W6Z1H0_AMBMO|nr:unnamed protein product [Ambrosiozyma monospora]
MILANYNGYTLRNDKIRVRLINYPDHLALKYGNDTEMTKDFEKFKNIMQSLSLELMVLIIETAFEENVLEFVFPIIDKHYKRWNSMLVPATAKSNGWLCRTNLCLFSDVDHRLSDVTLSDGIFLRCLTLTERMERVSFTDQLDQLRLLEKPVSAKIRVYWNLDNPNSRGPYNGKLLLSMLKEPKWQGTSLDIFVTQQSKAAFDRSWLRIMRPEVLHFVKRCKFICVYDYSQGFTFPHCSNLETMEVRPLTSVMFTPEIPSLKELSLISSTLEQLKFSFRGLPQLKKLQLNDVNMSGLINGIDVPRLSVLVIKNSYGKLVGHLPSSLRFLEITESSIDDILGELPQLTKLSELRFSYLDDYTIEHLFKSIPPSVLFFYLSVVQNCELSNKPKFVDYPIDLSLLPAKVRLFNFEREKYSSNEQCEVCFDLRMNNGQYYQSELGWN